MFSNPFNDPVGLMIRLPVILLALTVHEFCHAYFAFRMGDPTAYRLGRCSLNPLRHLDFWGTICLLFAPIGWAKPVPINPLNFHDWRKGTLVSTAAGPLSNLVQAFVCALLLRALMQWGHYLEVNSTMLQFMILLELMLRMGIIINVGLTVFNLLPIYPLDGFHITLQFVSRESQQRFAETARYGPFLILGLILIGRNSEFDLLGHMMDPVLTLMRWVAGLS